MIEIRRAMLADCGEIQKLNNELFEIERENFDKYLIKDWPLSKEGEEYFSEAIKNDFVAVAEQDGKVVGYILGAISTIPYYNFEVAEVCNMCVAPSFRGRGIGKMLINSFKHHYKGCGVKKFVVTASVLNEKAIGFYKSQGFKVQNITLCDFD